MIQESKSQYHNHESYALTTGLHASTKRQLSWTELYVNFVFKSEAQVPETMKLRQPKR